MAEFRRFLLVTGHDARIAKGNWQVDIVSWDSLKSIGNPADYDGWILNTTALQTRPVRKIFTSEELNVLFDYRGFIAVMQASGRIFIIGDFKTAFYVPASTGGGGAAPKASSAPREQQFNIFEKMLNVERDPRPVDYRRISRPDDYRYREYYAYLDKVAAWNYSLNSRKMRQISRPWSLVQQISGRVGSALFLVSRKCLFTAFFGNHCGRGRQICFTTLFRDWHTRCGPFLVEQVSGARAKTYGERGKREAPIT